MQYFAMAQNQTYEEEKRKAAETFGFNTDGSQQESQGGRHAQQNKGHTSAEFKNQSNTGNEEGSGFGMDNQYSGNFKQETADGSSNPGNISQNNSR